LIPLECPLQRNLESHLDENPIVPQAR
jgi:hypothetical protein